MDRTFKYIDKDRFVPWLEKKIDTWTIIGDECENMIDASAAYARASSYKEVLELLVTGLWDWQPSE